MVWVRGLPGLKPDHVMVWVRGLPGLKPDHVQGDVQGDRQVPALGVRFQLPRPIEAPADLESGQM